MLVKVSGDGQSGTVGAPLLDKLTVRVTRDGSGLSGVPVSWRVEAGGGSIAGTAAVTDATGTATATWTLGLVSAVDSAVTATAQGVAGAPVRFTAASVAGDPVALTFRSGPTGTRSQVVMRPVEVGFVDTYGNTVTSATHQIALALAANPAGGVLSGTAQVTAVGGAAHFAELSVDRVGAGHRLEATASGLTAATSGPFQVGPQLIFGTLPAETFSDLVLASTLQVHALDAGLPYPGASIQLSLGGSSGAAQLVGLLAALTDAGGTATFGELRVHGRGPACTLRARAEPFTEAGTLGESSAFDVIEVDQEQAVIDSTAGIVLAIGGASLQRLAQSVTIQAAGSLVGVRVPVGCAAGYLGVSLQGVLTTGMPDGNVMATESFPASRLPAMTDLLGDFPLLRFTNPPALEAGAIVTINLDATDVCHHLPGPLGDPYDGGAGSFHALPNTGWALLGPPRDDLPFQVVMR